MSNPHDITRAFEAAVAEYTGAPYVVACSSCTAAIQGALTWHIQVDKFISDQRVDMDALPEVHMPSLSYVGVPAAIRSAGGRPVFWPIDWSGEYRMEPYFVWDSARRFTSGMYRPGAMQCLSFHATKILADSQGGAVLLDNAEAAAWLRRYFFDGRTYGTDPKIDQVMYPSMHAYMSPDVAARLLWKLQGLPRHNPDLPRSDYPDLSTMEAFK
jgi:dTDP-4-amino-4,6-dideoxygalactose transaminase